ncbi:MAG TPA: Ig-like domain-containing protein [Dissulfurispiraceae bacterium]|nr:Ig-like domain-containing protein [Dissulfurispiraceae bacterium]
MARAAIKNGLLAGVMVGSDVLLGANEYKASGSVRKTIEASEFGVAIDGFDYGSLDAGSITIPNVLSDPTSAAQAALDAAISAGTKFGPDEIKFMRDATSYWTIGTGGYLLITKSGGRGLGRNKLETCDYEFKLDSAELVLMPALVSIAITGGGLTCAAGAVQQLVATGTYTSGPTKDLTAVVLWASATEAKAVITRGGLVAGISSGTSDITATYMGITETEGFTVTAP